MLPVSAATHQLHSAIRANAVDAVRELLETGTDPNLSPPIPTFDDAKEDDDDETTIPEDHWFLRIGSEGKVTPLHMAIANCYHNFGDPDCNYDSKGPRARNARAILQLLIDHGADVQQLSPHLFVCNIRNWNWTHCPSSPLDFVLFLKQNAGGLYARQGTFLDEVVRTLQRSAKDSGHAKPLVAQVPKSVLQTWSKLLLSEKFSDVRFLCPEGVVLHAHRAVLAAASEYFDVQFSGPWADNGSDGEVKTSNSPRIMRAVLSFIYTGSMPQARTHTCPSLQPSSVPAVNRKPMESQALLESNAAELVGVAAEYGLIALRTLAEQSCIRTLAVDNVKGFLQLAHLHEAPELKAACVTYVKRHAATVLVQPDVMKLATEQPQLWAELAGKISSNGGATTRPASKKRART